MESSPVVEDGVVYIGSGFNGKAVVALRTGTDEELRKPVKIAFVTSDAPYPVTGAVTFVDGNIIVGGGNENFVFRDPNPADLLCLSMPRQVSFYGRLRCRMLFLAPYTKIFNVSVAAGKVIALDPKTGKQVWECHR